MNRRKALKYIAVTGPAMVLSIRKQEHVPRVGDYRTRPVTFVPKWLARHNHRLRTFLDGRDVTDGCFYANEAKGEVQCYKLGEGGNPYMVCSQGCEWFPDKTHRYKTAGEKHETSVAMHPVWRGKVEIRIC